MIVLPDAENHTVVSSFIWTKHRNVTEGQRDRIALAITAVCIGCAVRSGLQCYAVEMCASVSRG